MSSNSKSLILMMTISALMIVFSVVVGALTKRHWASFVAMAIALAAFLFFLISYVLNAKSEKKGKDKKDDQGRN